MLHTAKAIRLATTRLYSTAVGIEQGKKAAAYRAVSDYIDSTRKVVGIGSGSTIRYAVDCLREKKDLSHIVYIPTSFQSRQLIQQANLTIGTLEQYPRIDVTIDGADEVDPDLNCIKGGGACHLQEKIIAYASSTVVIIADDRKLSRQLGVNWTNGVPLEVLPMAYSTILSHLEEKYPSVKASLRMATEKAGPVITDNGNFVIDAHFGPISSPADLANQLKLMPGIIEVGLFCNMVETAFFGSADGSVNIQAKK